MNSARLLWLLVRLGLLNEFVYRGNLVAQFFYSAIGPVGSLAFLAAVFARTETLAGWTPPELLVLVGVFYLLTGLLGMFVQPSLQLFIEEVRLGSFDFTLTKPVEAQVLVSTKRVEIWRMLDVGIGVGLVAIGVVQIGPGGGPAPVIAFLIALAAGGATVYSCILVLATLAFWFVRVENLLVIFLTFWEAGRWPVQVYPPWLRGTLTFLVPVAIATTVPAEALVGRLGLASLLAALAISFALLLISRWFWQWGVRHYSGASA